MSEFRRDFVSRPRPISAEVERDRMIQRQVAAGRAERAPISTDLRRGAAPAKLVSANEARNAMIRRSR